MLEPMNEMKASRLRAASERTCVGCRCVGERGSLVRLVLSEVSDADERGVGVGVDAKGGASGRGAWICASPSCLEKAVKGGIARAMKRRVLTSAEEVAEHLVVAYGARLRGLLLASRRTHAVALGADAVWETLETERPLLVVARDAGRVAQDYRVVDAAGRGDVVVWGDKATLGKIFGKAEIAIFALRDEGLEKAVRHVGRILQAFEALASSRRAAGVASGTTSSAEVE